MTDHPVPLPWPSDAMLVGVWTPEMREAWRRDMRAYGDARAAAAAAAERERGAGIVHRMAVDPAMTDDQSAALFDAERALRA